MQYNYISGGRLVSGERVQDWSTTLNGTASILVVPKNYDRKHLIISLLTTSDVWMNFGIPAVKDSPSIKLQGNMFYIFQFRVSTEDIWMLKDGNGTTNITVKEG